MFFLKQMHNHIYKTSKTRDSDRFPNVHGEAKPGCRNEDKGGRSKPAFAVPYEKQESLLNILKNLPFSFLLPM